MRKIIPALLLVFMTSFTSVQAQTVLFQDPELLKAASLGDYDKIRSALVKGDNPDTVNVQNETPLIIATKGEYFDIVELLLEYNANINWQDSIGNTAIFYSVDKSAYEMVEFLIENKANPNIQNRNGITALMIAAVIGDRDILQMILDTDPDLTLRDYTGRTLLDYARNSRNRGAENILRNAGATD